MISVKNLSRVFDSRGIAGVHGVSFELSKGQVMAIMGPNGSGKSTLLKLLQGTEKPLEGDLRIDGEISFFPAADELSHLNVQKFLVRSVHLEIEEEKKIQLSRDLADTFEFTFQLRQNLQELSSGQRQKVLLAKELINRPGLLLMDEPFAHLDPLTRREILQNLFSYIKNQGTTVLWVTHDLEEAFQFSDKIGLLNFGKFEQQGSPEELVRTPRNLFVAQFMGYRNFFSEPNSNELLVVPDHAWEEDADGISCRIEARHPIRQQLEYRLNHEGKVLFLTQGSQVPMREVGSFIKLRPVRQECFHIPL